MKTVYVATLPSSLMIYLVSVIPFVDCVVECEKTSMPQSSNYNLSTKDTKGDFSACIQPLWTLWSICWSDSFMPFHLVSDVIKFVGAFAVKFCIQCLNSKRTILTRLRAQHGAIPFPASCPQSTASSQFHTTSPSWTLSDEKYLSWVTMQLWRTLG